MQSYHFRNCLTYRKNNVQFYLRQHSRFGSQSSVTPALPPQQPWSFSHHVISPFLNRIFSSMIFGSPRIAWRATNAETSRRRLTRIPNLKKIIIKLFWKESKRLEILVDSFAQPESPSTIINDTLMSGTKMTSARKIKYEQLVLVLYGALVKRISECDRARSVNLDRVPLGFLFGRSRSRCDCSCQFVLDISSKVCIYGSLFFSLIREAATSQ